MSTISIRLPDIISAPMGEAAEEVLSAHADLEQVRAAEPDVAATLPGTDHQEWLRWNTDSYEPAVRRWNRTAAALREFLPTGFGPDTIRRVAEAVVEQWREQTR